VTHFPTPAASQARAIAKADRPLSLSPSYRIIEFVPAFPALSEACDFSCAEGMQETNNMNQGNFSKFYKFNEISSNNS
jgi:hypothetical protein